MSEFKWKEVRDVESCHSISAMTNLSVCSTASQFSCLGLPSLLIQMAAAAHIIFLLYEALCCCVPLCLCRTAWLLCKSKVAPLQRVCWVCLTWINAANIDQSIKCLISQTLLQCTHQIHLSACASMELLLIYPIYQFAHSSIYLLIQASRISALTFNPLHPYTGFSSLPL